MNTSQNNVDHFSYIRGRNVHALFTIKKTISAATINGFVKTTDSINKELKRMKIPLNLSFFTLPVTDDDGNSLGGETFYITYNGNVSGELISLMYLEHAHRLLGAEF